jgi:hypothetical protein
MSLALRTDRYELTMLEGALATGVADRRAVFEVFARRLPPGRRFGIVAGQGRLAALLPGSGTARTSSRRWTSCARPPATGCVTGSCRCRSPATGRASATGPGRRC